MTLKFSLRFKIFFIATLVIVAGQIIYAKSNVEHFQATYLETMREKSTKLGTFLKTDVEYLLSLNIPINKLTKLENSLKNVHQAFPELHYIEITDLEGFQLYYADRDSIRKAEQRQRKSASQEDFFVETLTRSGMSIADVDVQLPLVYHKTGKQVGNITLRLNPESFLAQSQQILWDMITVILISLLIIFEILNFFISFTITSPLEQVGRIFQGAIDDRSRILSNDLCFNRDLGVVIHLFNDSIEQLRHRMRLVNYARHIYPDLANIISHQIEQLSQDIQNIPPTLPLVLQEKAKSNLVKTHDNLIQVKRAMGRFSMVLVRPLWLLEYANSEKIELRKSTNKIPLYYIRPLVFLFVMADGFCTSFFPIYSETLYEPILGLSKEIVSGVPISLFMLCFAITMPVTGYWTDRVGWFRPLVVGIVINAAGLLLTAFSESFIQLLFARAVTGIGFGIAFMSCQRFVYDNTTPETRILGNATFLAAFFSGDICGTVIGGILVDRIGYANVFVISGAIALFSLAYCLFAFGKEQWKAPGEQNKQGKSHGSLILKDVFYVLKDPMFTAIMFLQAIPAKIILIGCLFYFVPMYLSKMGTLQADIGRIIMCYGIVLVFLGPCFSKYFAKVHLQKYYVGLGGLLTSIAMIGFYFYSEASATLVLVIVMGIAYTMSSSAQVSVICETPVFKEIGVGAGLGLFRFWERVGNITGPLIMGALMVKFGYEMSVVILGLSYLVTSMFYFLFLFVHSEKNEDT